MIKTIEITEKVKHIDYVKCDKCGKEIYPTDHQEYSEIHFINFIGGFSSVFGDSCVVDCELCQHCLKEMIIDYCRIDGEKVRKYEKI